MVTYTLKVVEIRKETADTITLCFKQPVLRKIKYKAGQYLSFIFRINDRRYVRPYSFSSAPSVDALLEVSVKRVANGIVSNHIHDQIKVGDCIEVIQPMGEFILHENKSIEEIYFWGVGSGITPLMSLIKEVLNLNKLINIILVYGNRNFESTIFSSIIDSLIACYPNRFRVFHFHTQFSIREANPFVIEGRINKDYVFKIMNGSNVNQMLHYICGPVGLKESVKEALSILNVDSNNIFSEDFQLIKDPQEFEDLYTQIVRLKFQGSEYNLEVIKGKSILEAALDAGLELPYSCQTGNCSTCKANCVSGKIKMIGLTNERSDLGGNEFLLCCSHPLTENVYLVI